MEKMVLSDREFFDIAIKENNYDDLATFLLDYSDCKNSLKSWYLLFDEYLSTVKNSYIEATTDYGIDISKYLYEEDDYSYDDDYQDYSDYEDTWGEVY